MKNWAWLWIVAQLACGQVTAVDPDAGDPDMGGPVFSCGDMCGPNVTCTGDVCSCNPGFGDCDNDISTTGCETDIRSDAQNCGACGVKCPSGQVCVNAGCGCGFTQLSAGSLHTCAVRSDSSVACWGQNATDGQLGNNRTPMQNEPKAILVPGLSGVAQVSAGAAHTCARKSDGSVLCWGLNTSGQLGDASSVDKYVPTPVNASLGNVTDLDVGAYHSCAISGGAVYCWGTNNAGQIGDGTTMGRNIPVLVSTITNAVKVDAGQGHSCAITSDKTVHCWGWNNVGQLGDGTLANCVPVGNDFSSCGKSLPAAVLNLTNVEHVSLGHSHTCAVKTDGTVWCWGYNPKGQLGDPTLMDRSMPVQVSSLAGVIQVGAGGFRDYAHGHSCAARGDGTIACWGGNDLDPTGVGPPSQPNGQLGDGTNVTSSAIPLAVTGLSSAATVSGGGAHTCALDRHGNAFCWGWNRDGQLGNNSTTGSFVPVKVLCP